MSLTAGAVAGLVGPKPVPGNRCYRRTRRDRSNSLIKPRARCKLHRLHRRRSPGNWKKPGANRRNSTLTGSDVRFALVTDTCAPIRCGLRREYIDLRGADVVDRRRLIVDADADSVGACGSRQ
jgi:hypothetical protein